MGQTGRRSIATHILAVKIGLATVHFHGFGVALAGSWNTWVNNPIYQRMSNARKVPSRASSQTSGGGVSNQVMPFSVILKTVAPTRVALGLGSM
jgi:hypothetical protein